MASHSDSGVESDMDIDDHEREQKTSTELARYDQSLLQDDEEHERFLVGKNSVPSKGFMRTIKDKRAVRRAARDSRPYTDGDEGRELMHDAEDDNTSRKSLNSEERDGFGDHDEKMPPKMKAGKGARFKKVLTYLSISIIVIVVFLALAFGAFNASKGRSDRTESAKTLISNGTALFEPTTILISLDGFRADFLQQGITPNLNKLIEGGVSPKYMTPSFPSVTFPNHFTLVTGLYPESHGVVGNTFWDPALEEEFYYTHPANSMQPKWWSAEPIWVTAEDQDVRTAIHMWPGSEAHIPDKEPSFLDKFNGEELLSNKVKRILELLDLPGWENKGISKQAMRPAFIAAYVPNVDANGHLFGPNSTETRESVMTVDTMLGDIISGLGERNLTTVVNIIVVSDHGMATTSTSRLLQFEDLVDPSLIEHTDGWPHYGLRPKDLELLPELYAQLSELAKEKDGFDVFLRDENMPERFHFSANERIAPLWIFPWTGWAIVKREEMVVTEALESGAVYHPKGIHGYDNEHPLMRAIFVARGPAFPHPAGSKVDNFHNIEVYNILCDSLQIEPQKNNGTLRLPLVTTGLHSDDEADEAVLEDDEMSFGIATVIPPSVGLPTPVMTGSDEAQATRPVIYDDDELQHEEDELERNWQAWIKGKLDAFNAWVHRMFGDVEEEEDFDIEFIEDDGGAK